MGQCTVQGCRGCSFNRTHGTAWKTKCERACDIDDVCVCDVSMHNMHHTIRYARTHARFTACARVIAKRKHMIIMLLWDCVPGQEVKALNVEIVSVNASDFHHDDDDDVMMVDGYVKFIRLISGTSITGPSRRIVRVPV